MMCFVKIMDLGTALFLYKATQIDQIAFRTTTFFDVNLFLTAISWVHRRWPRTYRVIINPTHERNIYTDDGAKFIMHLVLVIWPEVRIYKRKQESEKKEENVHALDQENDQENKVFSYFLGRCLGRERVFFLFFSLSCFLL